MDFQLDKTSKVIPSIAAARTMTTSSLRPRHAMPLALLKPVYQPSRRPYITPRAKDPNSCSPLSPPHVNPPADPKA